MPEGGKQEASGLTGVLDRIAQGLEGQPALQVVLGGGILLVVLAGVVGGVAADQLWLFVVALVALVFGGLVAWAVRGRGQGEDVVSDEELRVGKDANIRDDAQVLHHEGAGPAQRKVRISTGGDFNASGRAKVGGSSSGTAPERREEQPPAPDAGP